MDWSSLPHLPLEKIIRYALEMDKERTPGFLPNGQWMQTAFKYGQVRVFFECTLVFSTHFYKLYSINYKILVRSSKTP